MTKPVPAISVLSVFLFTAGLAAAEPLPPPTPEEVRQQIRTMEEATARSSNSLQATIHRDAKLRMLDRAEQQAAQGNVATAMEIVEQAGRMLDPADMVDTPYLEGEMREEWLGKIDKVMDAILPAAYDIAKQKDGATTNLDWVRLQLDQSRAAWKAGDADQAETLLVAAYNVLQAEVANLRSGDLLMIELPSSANRDGWEEAERRYLDWRFTADWMEQSALALGADPELIATGSRLAEALYEEAKTHAADQKWAAAVNAIDRAYAVMEKHWRAAGIDI